jgi:hypothetical protein
MHDAISHREPQLRSLRYEFATLRRIEHALEQRRRTITPERVASILFQRFCSNLNTDLESWYKDGLLAYEAIIGETK